MNSSANSTVHHPQHKNKCYCNNGNFCCCFGNKVFSKDSTSSRKFIKIRKDKTNYKPTSLIGINSSCEVSSPTPTSMTSISASASFNKGLSSESRLTGRREFYERSKAGSTDVFDMCTWNTLQPTEPEHICDQRVAKLQEFRLQNASECLSSSSRYSIEKVFQVDPLNKVDNGTEVKYTLNERGLLKPIGGKDGQLTAFVSSKAATKDILMQRLNSTKEKEKFLRKALCMPDKSLALRYQKTY